MAYLSAIVMAQSPSVACAPCRFSLGRSSGLVARTVLSSEGRHHVLGEPAQLLLELLGRDAFRPVDHEMLEPRIFRRDGLDAVDDLLARAAEARLALDAVPRARRPRRRPGRAPGSP